MPDIVWIRECQECGHYQRATPPDTMKELTDGYRNAMCKKCKSEGSLDYGSYYDPITRVARNAR